MRGTRRDPRAHAILEYVSRESVEHPRQVPPAPPASLMACATLLLLARSNTPQTNKFPLRAERFGISVPRNLVINDGANGRKAPVSKDDGGASFPCSRAPRARTMHGPGSPAWGSTRHTPAPHLPAYLPSVRAGSPSTVSNTNPPVFGLPSASPHSRPSGRTRVLKGRTCPP